MKTKPTPRTGKLAHVAAPKQITEQPLTADQDLAILDKSENLLNAGTALTAIDSFLRSNPDSADIQTLYSLLTYSEQMPGATLRDAVKAHAAGLPTTRIDNRELKLLQAFQQIYRTDTPVASFLVSLVLAYTVRPLEPEDIRRRLAELESDFAAAIETARRFAKHYPELVIQAAPSEAQPAA